MYGCRNLAGKHVFDDGTLGLQVDNPPSHAEDSSHGPWMPWPKYRELYSWRGLMNVGWEIPAEAMSQESQRRWVLSRKNYR
jgi:hypothetical protein